MKPINARVSRVVDGDTVVLQVRCRLSNIDAAEVGSVEGNAARQALSDRIGGSKVTVTNQFGGDAYGRWLVILAPLRGGSPLPEGER